MSDVYLRVEGWAKCRSCSASFTNNGTAVFRVKEEFTSATLPLNVLKGTDKRKSIEIWGMKGKVNKTTRHRSANESSEPPAFNSLSSLRKCRSYRLQISKEKKKNLTLYLQDWIPFRKSAFGRLKVFPWADWTFGCLSNRSGALRLPAVTLILTTKTPFNGKASLILAAVISSNTHFCLPPSAL